MKTKVLFSMVFVILFCLPARAEEAVLQARSHPRVWDQVLDPQEIYIVEVCQSPTYEYLIGTEDHLHRHLGYYTAAARVGLKKRIRAHGLMGRMRRADYYEVNKAYKARFLEDVVSFQIHNPLDKDGIVNEVRELNLGLESRVAEVHLARILYEIYDSRETFSEDWEVYY